LALGTRDSPSVTVRDKWSGEVFAELERATEPHVEATLANAVAALREPWAPRERAAALNGAVALLKQRRDAVTTGMRRETGFTTTDVNDEFDRAMVTLELCAEEATRLGGEVIPLGASSGFEQRIAFTIRVPIGVVLAITPFNAPLNTVCHKIGPALAAGNSVVLKPAQLTPLTAQTLVDTLHESGVPKRYLQVVHGSGGELGLRLLRDPRIAFATFTGSTEVGLTVKRETGIRPVQLELGSTSTTIVCDDADLDRVASDVRRSGFRKAGQVCTSVQNLLVQRGVAGELRERLARGVASLRSGDPGDSQTDVGPVITEQAAEWAHELVSDAVRAGAEVAVGAGRERNLLSPTLLTGVVPGMRIMSEEIFAPVVNLISFDAIADAFAIANASRYGLQAGFYTSSIANALLAARSLEVGGVIVNGTSSTRADGMPYGGVKDSGFGREGPAYAISEMTVPRLVMLIP
jgi:succinate-semialdehyde dehydrogenase / glutarate-semialdehyde dehydrogenase